MSEIIITKPETLFATSISGDGLIQLPTVRDLEESEALASQYSAILTAGPNIREVDFGHKNHRVWSFGDQIAGAGAPRIEQIEEAITWGAEQDDLLVHCHAGISRSTATAWGVSILKGADPEEALRVLYKNHPMEMWPQYGSLFKSQTMHKRPFMPNQLIVAHLEDILGFKENELLAMLARVGINYYH